MSVAEALLGYVVLGRPCELVMIPDCCISNNPHMRTCLQAPSSIEQATPDPATAALSRGARNPISNPEEDPSTSASPSSSSIGQEPSQAPPSLTTSTGPESPERSNAAEATRVSVSGDVDIDASIASASPSCEPTAAFPDASEFGSAHEEDTSSCGAPGGNFEIRLADVSASSLCEGWPSGMNILQILWFRCLTIACTAGLYFMTDGNTFLIWGSAGLHHVCVQTTIK